MERLTWLRATVAETITENPRARSLILNVPGWPGHKPGQHLKVRLTAEDGYQASRDYSLATSSSGEQIGITVERLENGEVSPYLVDELQIGDSFEVRGPIGGYFVWETMLGGPLVLVAGGSGVVPFMSMLRYRKEQGDTTPTRLLYSVRSPDDIIYQEELKHIAKDDLSLTIIYTFTRKAPEGWPGYARRVDMDMLKEVAFASSENPLVYICGPNMFVENIATLLTAFGLGSERIFTERFGAST